MTIGSIILAAGKGTRMKSTRHKVLHEIGGLSMIGHVLRGLDALGVGRRVVVVGAGRDEVAAALSGDVAIAVQEPQLGTGHAVLAAGAALGNPPDVVLILYGDVPLIRAETLQKMVDRLRQDPGCAAMVLGFRAADPGVYGRLILAGDGALQAIVEYKDATSSERAVDLCNSGLMAVRGGLLFPLLEKVGNANAAGEYYLTDIVAIAVDQGHRIQVVEAEEAEVQGVNDRRDLARAEAVFQQRMRDRAMLAGVSLVAPETVWFSHDTQLHPDVRVEPDVVFGLGVVVETGATIKAFSHLERCRVGGRASIGPFARLRPGAEIGANAKIGNFVEVKAARVGEGAKISHLSYIGDADIGANANIGAGTITCNYDGYFKYRTVVGESAFIGSNTALVAPVTVGAGAMVGAGSVVVRDIEPGALGVARAPQAEKPGWAAAFAKTMQARKAKAKGKA